MSTTNFINSSKGLKQPSKENPFLPREWVHMFHEIEITRKSDGQSILLYHVLLQTFFKWI